MSFALLAASTSTRDTYLGNWSPYTLLFAVFIAFIALVLIVVLIIYAMMGRLSPGVKPRGEFSGEDGEDEDAPSMDAALKRSQKTALRKAQEEEAKSPAKKPRRKTGWQYLLGAIACSVASILVFIWVDNPMGQMRGLTFGAVMNGLLLALQIFLTVRFALCQRRLPR